jgi:hypothetical protein
MNIPMVEGMASSTVLVVESNRLGQRRNGGEIAATDRSAGPFTGSAWD